jgi:3-hydroxybutyryl-CoA dehydrogenase
MESISVLGAGLMGHSIALNGVWAGDRITLWGTDQRDLDRARSEISNKLKLLYENQLTGGVSVHDIMERLTFVTDLDAAVRHATFIIEAVPEDLELKQQFYEKLDGKCGPEVVLASNTSGLSPTSIAKRMIRPERMVVTHFWNPAHLIPLVEVVSGEHTSQATVERAMELLKQWNKKPIQVKKDIPGFVANRLQYALFREAQYILQEGVASVEDIDAAVQYSMGRRLPVTGPFMTADMGGLDVFHAISSYLFRDLSNADGSYPPMRTLAETGHYGTKTGKGFYQWDDDTLKAVNIQREQTLIRFLQEDEQTHRVPKE